MPAPLNQDAVAYLKQQNIPVTTQSLNRTMNLLNQQPNLRPSYSGQSGALNVDPDTMTPIRETGPLPPLQQGMDGDFKSAFAAARKKLGANGTFDWQGKKYNTKYKEEVGSGTGEDKRSNALPTDPLNMEEVDQIQDDLRQERELDSEQRPANTSQGILGNQSRGRGGAARPDDSDSQMEALLAALGVGTAAVAGGAIASKMGGKKPTQYDSNVDDEFGKVADEIGKPKPNIINEEDEMSAMLREAFPDESLREFETKAADGTYIREEAQAVEAIKTKNKVMARKLLPRLENLSDDPKLIAALKAIL